ncbi:MAG TPA: hypothetical protein VN688_05790 [Gemmataceae bacterium]|nr:hypothetical protein [Gemmataceae bacterium]
MADKSNQLILSALSRAAATPAGVPLHGGKAVTGLFPTNAAGKQAAQRSQEDGYLCLVAVEDAVSGDSGAGGTATLVKKKTTGYPLCAITEKGLTYLLSQVSPRQVLEDFVRAVEAREKQADDLLAIAHQMQQSLSALKANAEKVLQHTYQPESSPEHGGTGSLRTMLAGFLQEDASPQAAPASPAAALHDILLAELTRWHSAGASEDCPLPHLFQATRNAKLNGTIGQFHDALRQLHDQGQIYLHPWTGPLYDIPEPPYTLLIGHEIAYYASIRK